MSISVPGAGRRLAVSTVAVTFLLAAGSPAYGGRTAGAGQHARTVSSTSAGVTPAGPAAATPASG